MKIISLGGVGGCDLAKALRNLNQLTYPYDWIISTQTFIIDSFNNINNFFKFNKKYVHNHKNLLVYNKKAVILHDFKKFSLEKKQVIMKYKRRFIRLNESLNSNDDILFVRIYDNLEENLSPDYNNILIRDEEDIEKWDTFINNIQDKYNKKKIKLLIIYSKENIISKTYNNIIMVYTKEHKNNKFIYNIIQDTLKSKF